MPLLRFQDASGLRRIGRLLVSTNPPSFTVTDLIDGAFGQGGLGTVAVTIELWPLAPATLINSVSVKINSAVPHTIPSTTGTGNPLLVTVTLGNDPAEMPGSASNQLQLVVQDNDPSQKGTYTFVVQYFVVGTTTTSTTSTTTSTTSTTTTSTTRMSPAVRKRAKAP